MKPNQREVALSQLCTYKMGTISAKKANYVAKSISLQWF